MSDRNLIRQFNEVAHRDYETAMRYLALSDNNVQRALLQYFEEIDGGGNAPAPAENSASTGRMGTHPLQQPPIQLPQENRPDGLPEFRYNEHRNSVTNTSTTLTLPFGRAKSENIKPRGILVRPAAITNSNGLCCVQDIDAPHVVCTIWKNGISLGDTFIPKNDGQYAVTMEQIHANQIPASLKEDLCDLELRYELETDFI